MEQRQRAGDVAQAAAGGAPRERCDAGQVWAERQLHRVVRSVALYAVLEHADDARMVEAGEHLKLALERRGVDRAPLALRLIDAHALECAHPTPGGVAYAVHLAHATSGQHLLDDVALGDA
jgi:hypothetical protein